MPNIITGKAAVKAYFTSRASRDFTYITPAEMHEMCKDAKRPAPLDELTRRATAPEAKCDCGRPSWRYMNNGMCFECTTGESDRTGYYELRPES